MSFIILFILIIAFGIYMFMNDGYIYISSKHFEKEISIEKIKNKGASSMGPRCEKCGGPLDTNQNICSKCINKELEEYSSSNPFGGQKNSRKKF